MLLKNQLALEEIKREVKIYQKKKKKPHKYYVPNSMGQSKSCSINKLNLHVKKPEKKEQMKPKISGRKEIIKIRAEINEVNTKKKIEKINTAKSWFFEKTNKLEEPLVQTNQEKKEDSKK